MKKLITTASLLALLAAGPALAQSTSPSADPAKPSMGDTTTSPSGTTPGSTGGATDMQRSPSQDMTAPDATAPDSSAAAPSADADKTAQIGNDAVSATGIQVSELMGAAVRNSANESIGNINDVLLTKDGQVDGVIVGVGGFLGLGEKNVALKFSELQIDNSNPNEPKITSTATSDALAAAPEWNEPGSATGMSGSSN